MQTRSDCAFVLEELCRHEPNQAALVKASPNLFRAINRALDEEDLQEAAGMMAMQLIAGSSAGKMPPELAKRVLELPLAMDEDEAKLKLVNGLVAMVKSRE